MRQYRSYSLLGDKIWPNHVRLKHLKWDQDLWLMRNPKVP